MVADAIPPAPIAVPMLRHERVEAEKVCTKPFNVDSPVTTLAKALTDKGVPTAKGSAVWSPMQVSRALKALA